jgi:uncharacterized integral membrane protein (TIGR00697 family)
VKNTFSIVFLQKMDSFLLHFIERMHTIPAEYVTLFSIFFSGFAIVITHRYCRLTGLFIYNVLAVILANIQVLRLSQFSLFPDPMALGTVLFSTTFLVNDIINEIYGPDKAKDNVKYCFFASILCSLFMIVDLCHRPAASQDPAYLAMMALFVPSLRILTSSLIAFFISQWFDVLLFKWLKEYFHGKVLWLRTFIASLFSFLLDNIIFCYLAWSLLSPDPLGAYDIFKTYVIGTYITRVLLGVFLIPTIYQCKKHV